MEPQATRIQELAEGPSRCNWILTPTTLSASDIVVAQQQDGPWLGARLIQGDNDDNDHWEIVWQELHEQPPEPLIAKPGLDKENVPNNDSAATVATTTTLAMAAAMSFTGAYWAVLRQDHALEWRDSRTGTLLAEVALPRDVTESSTTTGASTSLIWLSDTALLTRRQDSYWLVQWQPPHSRALSWWLPPYSYVIHAAVGSDNDRLQLVVQQKQPEPRYQEEWWILQGSIAGSDPERVALLPVPVRQSPLTVLQSSHYFCYIARLVEDDSQTRGDRLHIIWWDLQSNQVVARQPLWRQLSEDEDASKDKHLQVQQLAMWMTDHESILVTAVLFQTRGITILQIYQSVLEETMGLELLGPATLLFEIPLPGPPISLCRLASGENPWALVCLTASGPCWQVLFNPLVPPLARALQQHEQSYEAWDALEETMSSNPTWFRYLQNDVHAAFHPSLVTRERWKVVLRQLAVDPDREGTLADAAQDCLRILSTGALTRHLGFVTLLEAADDTVPTYWAAAADAPSTTTLNHYTQVLSWWVAALHKLQAILPESRAQPVATVVRQFQARIQAVCWFENVAALSRHDELPWERIKSPVHLFVALLQKADLSAATWLYRRSERRSGNHEETWTIGTDVIISSLVHHLPLAPVASYAGFLLDVVWPRLGHLGHEMVPILQAWACQRANGYDDLDRLPDAILLLEVSVRVRQTLQIWL
jgi:hypothetical protein